MDTAQTNWEITHFYRRPVEEGLWLPIYFITRDPQGVYHSGTEKPDLLDDGRKPCKDERNLSHKVERLAEPIKINPDSFRGVMWMNPEGEVYLSLSEEDNPVTDTNKRLIARPNLEGVTSTEDDIIAFARNSSTKIPSENQ